MSLQSPIVVVADQPNAELTAAITARGGAAVVAASWADAARTILAAWPAAILIDEPADTVLAGTLAAIREAVETLREPYLPVLARTVPGAAPIIAGALPISPSAAISRVLARLSSALRVRGLHAAVFRRASLLKSGGGQVPALPKTDPLDEATVLVTGRGPAFPALTTAIGERMGLIGCLSVESAARYLNARDVDGVVIGDGFSRAAVDALLTALGEDMRFRDLPIALPAGSPVSVDCSSLPNCERLDGDALAIVEWIAPLVRLHAYEARLQRQLAAIEAKGMLDPQTGLFTVNTFLRDLNRAVEAAKQQGDGLVLARFAFLPFVDRRTALDAARLAGRLVRSVDFACRAGDGSILLALPNTQLQAAQGIARRIAGSLKGAMLSTEATHLHNDPMVALAALQPTDTAETLLQRVAQPAKLAAG